MEYFKNIKVIELAGVLAGPSAGMFFAELGSEVVKVENPAAGGDVTRQWKLPDEKAGGPSAYFSSVNYLKTYLHLDLTTAHGQKLLHREIADADIVIANYKPGSAEKLKADYKTLSALNPSLIYISLKGFEYSDAPAFDVVLQAETGFMSMNGTQESGPVKMPVAIVDILAGHQIKEAALVAIINRLHTGGGAYIEVSLESAALAALANQATNYLMNGAVAGLKGSLHPNIAPYGEILIFADGVQVVLAAGSDAQFRAICESLKCGDAAHMKQFSTNVKRVENREKLHRLLQQCASRLSGLSVAKEFSARKVPFGKIKAIDEVMGSDAAKRLLRSERIEGRETHRMSSIAWTLSPPSEF